MDAPSADELGVALHVHPEASVPGLEAALLGHAGTDAALLAVVGVGVNQVVPRFLAPRRAGAGGHPQAAGAKADAHAARVGLAAAVEAGRVLRGQQTHFFSESSDSGVISCS